MNEELKSFFVTIIIISIKTSEILYTVVSLANWLNDSFTLQRKVFVTLS